MYFYQAAARAVREHGTTVMFGLIGDGNLYFVDSFVRQQGGQFVPVAFEASAVQAAAGYTRTSGQIGVATVTHGPALTNTVTPLIEAARARTPLVLIAGDTAVADKLNLQNVDQRAIILPTGAGFEQVRTPDSFAEDLDAAFRRAELESGPVVLNVPADFQWLEIEPPAASPRPVVRQSFAASEDALDTALGLIASARRPVVLAGRGAGSDAARAAVLSFARRIGAPVATSLQTRELFRGEPEDLGIFGTLSTPGALELISQADCMVTFGASLNRWTTAEGGLTSGRRIVQVDRDPAALNRFTIVDAPVLGDIEAVCEQFVAGLDAMAVEAGSFAQRVSALPADEPPVATRTAPGTVDIDTALRRIDERFPLARSLVLDAGRYFHHAAYNVHTGAPLSYVHTLEFGCIGLGMASAIGAAVAQPEVSVLMIAGDGGFMLGGLVEFNTAVRCGLDIVVVIMNDAAYGAEHIQFAHKGMDPSLSTFDWPDLADVARALGGEGYAVRELADLERALDAIVGAPRTGPVLIDVHLDPERITSPYH
jgi:acetolactate synthase I/II/III large subunit